MTAQILPMRRKDGETDEFALDEQFLKLAGDLAAGDRVDMKMFGRVAKSYAERHRSRVPPNDLAAEAAVLSAILCERSALDRVADILPAEAFYSDANRHIYEAALALRVVGTPVDIVTIASWLRDREWIAQIGGASYLADLADKTPAVAHLVAHAERVVEMAGRRRIIALCQRIAAEGYTDIAAPLREAGIEADDTDEAWRALCVRRVEDAAHGTKVKPLATLSLALDEAFSNLHRVEARAGRVLGLTTGMPSLDLALGGLAPSDVTLIGARMKAAGKIETTSAGKSSFAAGIGMHVAQAGYTQMIDMPDGAREERHERIGVVMFILEMTRDQMAMRMACQVARIDWGELKAGAYTDRSTGRLFPDVWVRLEAAKAYLRSLPIVFDTDKPLTPSRARAKLFAARDQFARMPCYSCAGTGTRFDESDAKTACPECHGTGKRPARLGLAIYDSVGLMDPDRPSRDNNKEQNLNNIGRDLRNIATDERLPGVHHLEVTQIQENGDPKDCKSLKDHVVNRLIVDLEDDPDEDVIDGRIQIPKQRDGRRGVSVPICFHKKYGLFSDTPR
jgi:replicative DNA helicase